MSAALRRPLSPWTAAASRRRRSPPDSPDPTAAHGHPAHARRRLPAAGRGVGAARRAPGAGAAAAAADPAAADGEAADEGGLALEAYTLQHQPAAEAIELVRPLLSPRGTVELQPKGNTLVLRDSLAALARIVPVLRSFDHPARPVRLEILVVHASTSTVSPPVETTVPKALAENLRQLLRYDTFTLQAQADLLTLEGQQVVFEMGNGYAVRFQLGTLLANRRIKLHGFRVTRGGGAAAPGELINTNLNLFLDQTVTLALARREGSASALMVVITCRVVDLPAGAPPVGQDGRRRRRREVAAGGERAMEFTARFGTPDGRVEELTLSRRRRGRAAQRPREARPARLLDPQQGLRPSACRPSAAAAGRARSRSRSS